MPMRPKECRSGTKEVVGYNGDRRASGNTPDTMNDLTEPSLRTLKAMSTSCLPVCSYVQGKRVDLASCGLDNYVTPDQDKDWCCLGHQ